MAKNKGIGFVWGNTTQAIGELSGGVTSLAQAGRVLADNAVSHALLGKVEADMELLSAYGLNEKGFEAVKAARELKHLLLDA